MTRRFGSMIGCALALLACSDDAVTPMSMPDSGFDAAPPGIDGGPPPMCSADPVCGSPLVGTHCCTTPADVSAGVAVAAGRCGADLGTVAVSLRDRCVQLRQPGTLDDACPSRQVGTRFEPGCCTAIGVCGTSSTAADLGCQRALSLDAPEIACGGGGLDAGPDAE